MAQAKMRAAGIVTGAAWAMAGAAALWAAYGCGDLAAYAFGSLFGR